MNAPNGQRPWFVAAASMLLFAGGVATGWWMRGAGPAATEGDVLATEASVGGSTDGAVGPDGGVAARGVAASAADGGVVPGRAVDEAPRGEGSVAVVGASGEGARRVGGAGNDPASNPPPPPLDGGPPPSGRLDAAAIRDVVRESREQLGFCFAWQLHEHPELGGRLTMDFTIGTDGAVTRAEVVDDELGDETVQRCFRSVTQRMRFPAPEDGEVRVRYPFQLSADPDPDGEGSDAPPTP